MQAERFLHQLLNGVMHKKRIGVMSEIMSAVIETKQLRLTTLGRSLNPSIQERSGIRKVDRFLGNEFYQENNQIIYQSVIAMLVSNKPKPVIIVDWTKLPNSEKQVLRAALASEGRALTLYEEIHPHAGNAKVHSKFLKRLKTMFPTRCVPIVVTDAGFKKPWFTAILDLGWDYIGRVRGKTQYATDKGYKECETLHKQATYKAAYLGEKKLTTEHSLVTSFYIVKQRLRGRKCYTKGGKIRKDKDSRNYSRSQREPWLLVSSLKGKSAAKKVVELYKYRMTIEESFRDMKSNQYGFSLKENKTLCEARYVAWLLLSMLASLFAWIVGRLAEQKELHYQFQANTERRRRVLSFFYLGCQVIRKKIKLEINFKEINSFVSEIYL